MMKKQMPQTKKVNWDFSNIVVFLFLFLLPTQLGKHFFLPFSYLSGVRVDYLAPTIYLTDICAVFLAITNYKIIFQFFKNKTLLTILILLGINAAFALTPAVAAYRYIKIVELLIVFSIFKNIKIGKRIVFYGFFFSTVIQAILVVLQFVNKHALGGLFYFIGERYLTLSTPGVAKATIEGLEVLRSYGTFSHPNSLAGFFLLVYTFFLTTRVKVNVLSKNVLLYTAALIIFFSFSKASLLSFFLINLAFIIPFWRESLCKLCLSSRIVLFATLLLISLSTQTDPESFQKRIALIANAFDIIAKYPAAGVGLGNYLIAQNQFPNQPVHNILLLFFSEVGLITGAVVLYLLAKTLRIFLKNQVFIFSIFAVLFTGMFDHYWITLQQNFLVAGVIFGLISNPSVDRGSLR